MYCTHCNTCIVHTAHYLLPLLVSSDYKTGVNCQDNNSPGQPQETDSSGEDQEDQDEPQKIESPG